MTECTVFGENIETNVKKKSIEFIYYIDEELNIGSDCASPKLYNHILFLAQYGEYDCMYAYNNEDENGGTIYFGHWNDGAVE